MRRQLRGSGAVHGGRGFGGIPGVVTAVNEALAQTADLLNKDPHGQGWIARIRMKDTKDVESLFKAGDYEKFLEGLEH